MASPSVESIIGSGMTVSDKIRALAATGLGRADIGRLLGKRYQHVRNVLEADKLKASAGQAALRGVAETGASFDDEAAAVASESAGAGVYRLAVGADGSITLPAEMLRRFGWRPGGVVIGSVAPDGFVLLDPAENLRRIRRLVPRGLPGDALASDDLIAERRAEAEREEAESRALGASYDG